MPPTRLRPEQVRRTIALVIDDLGMSAESLNYTRGALRKYVDEQLQPGDVAAIIRTSSSIGSLQRFTNDSRLLHSAIERVTHERERQKRERRPDRRAIAGRYVAHARQHGAGPARRVPDRDHVRQDERADE